MFIVSVPRIFSTLDIYTKHINVAIAVTTSNIAVVFGEVYVLRLCYLHMKVLFKII